MPAGMAGAASGEFEEIHVLECVGSKGAHIDGAARRSICTRAGRFAVADGVRKPVAPPIATPEASPGRSPRGVRGSSDSATRRWPGLSAESGSAGVGQCPTHGVSPSPKNPVETQSVGRALLDTAMAWVQGRILERGRRAVLDPRGLIPSPTNPVAKSFVGRALLDTAMAWAQRRIRERGRRAVPDPRSVSLVEASSRAVLRGSSTARRGDGLGSATNPGTRASGSARPTECLPRRSIES
jgi:hypothetical protein